MRDSLRHHQPPTKSGDCGGPVCITINLPLNKGIVGASLHRSQSTTKSGDCGGQFASQSIYH